MRFLILIALTLSFSGCASLPSENTTLVRCSGDKRRPLNLHLWDWQEKSRQSRVDTVLFASSDWQISASYKSCGETRYG